MPARDRRDQHRAGNAVQRPREPGVSHRSRDLSGEQTVAQEHRQGRQQVKQSEGGDLRQERFLRPEELGHDRAPRMQQCFRVRSMGPSKAAESQQLTKRPATTASWAAPPRHPPQAQPEPNEIRQAGPFDGERRDDYEAARRLPKPAMERAEIQPIGRGVCRGPPVPYPASPPECQPTKVANGRAQE